MRHSPLNFYCHGGIPKNLRNFELIFTGLFHKFNSVAHFIMISGFNEDKINELAILRETRMLEDIKDAVEKKRDLEIKDMQGATAVSFLTLNSR